jgi:hypothetical protein
LERFGSKTAKMEQKTVRSAQVAWRKWGRNAPNLPIRTLPSPAPSRPTVLGIFIFLFLAALPPAPRKKGKKTARFCGLTLTIYFIGFASIRHSPIS